MALNKYFDEDKNNMLNFMFILQSKSIGYRPIYIYIAVQKHIDTDPKLVC